MKVAFVSECSAFYGILSKDLSNIFPSLFFQHFQYAEHFEQSSVAEFQLLILKLSGQELAQQRLLFIRKRFPEIKIIGLVLGRDFSSQKGIEKSFDFVFRDTELELKLNAYFLETLPKSNKPVSAVEMDLIKQRYIHLDPLKSRCLSLIYQRQSASQIALQLNKSVRTIEKYIIFLRQHFGVKRKKDLIEVCEQIVS